MKPEIAQLVATVKRELKARGLTYRDVAGALQLSEASVKRLFSSERFTVERLAEVAEMLGFTLSELLQKSAASVVRLHTLTAAQESELIADERLLMVTVCALNDLSIDYIVDTYHLARQEVVKRLRILDRMGVIELLPGDRIRRRVRRDFDWLPDGPIRRRFSHEFLNDFLHGSFAGGLQLQDFAHGVLTDAAQARLQVELRRLRATLASLHEESIAAPIHQKHGVGLFLALREWEPVSFRRRRRGPGKKASAPR